ncbi:hypothetical protein C1645_720001 [Glomus cerebriforme]|uniref:Uncharacterized protein n=1 Tax=Glomus cerebriforme TaxID=658196 RepID=A0A397TJH9_9GLOM|nr:hypothetical protein C1645_720001 [Glomus cerebriforme]
MNNNIPSLRRIDGNVRKKKTIRLLQIVMLMFFIIIMLNSIQVPTRSKTILSSQNGSAETSYIDGKAVFSPVDNEPLDLDESTESVKIVITKTTKQLYPKVNRRKKYDFTIITGASENHFCPIKGFIYNLKNSLKDLNGRLIIYDLGLTEIQRDELLSLWDDDYFDELRVFNFSAYPSFWNISEARGEYAWKPAIVAEVSKQYPGIITWLDSGTLPERKYFEELPSLLKKYDGFLSPRSSGHMNNWTHPGVYEYYDDDASKYDKIPNCNGASIAFDTKKTQHIIDEWYSCALDKDCIAPVGSSRLNHRQDQAILTYLTARENRYCKVNSKYFWIHAHQDDNCEKIINFYEKLYKINLEQ